MLQLHAHPSDKDQRVVSSLSSSPGIFSPVVHC